MMRSVTQVAIDQVPATALSVRSSATPELSAAPTTSNRPPYTAVPVRRPHCAAAAAVTRPASCAEPIVGAIFSCASSMPKAAISAES